MSMEQETLIYVEENDKSEARILAQSFAKKEIKSRAYINALGAELGMKYLALENITGSRLYNMHSVHRILEEFDISDIMLNNIHIDVRVVFDENYIFVPKSHFEYDILPDIYFVLLLSEDQSHAAFLGFFEPKLINKNNQNKDYYFIEKEKLTPPSGLKSFIENFKGNTTHSLSAVENEKAEFLMLSMTDQNITVDETKELLKMLQKSADLRDKFIEFENFELLAYKAEHSPYVTIPETITKDEVLDTTIDDLKSVDSDEAGAENLEFSAEEGISVENLELNAESGDLEIGDIELGDIDTSTVTDTADVLDTVEDIAQTVEAVQEVEESGELAAGAAAAGTVAAAGEVIADTVEEALENAVDMLESDNIVPEPEQNNAPDEILTASIDDLSDFNSDDLSELSTDESSTDINVSVDMSGGDSGMADMDQLTAKASAGNFSEASLDDFMADDNSSDGEDLISVETLQEETARRKGLLPSIDDESILESSLDFSKVEAVPQINEADLRAGMETVDISGFDSIAPEVRLEEGSTQEDDVLDISDVETKPNNFGANISETIEFNNIQQVDNSCENQTNKQNTAPTANLDDFGALEPLNSGNDGMFIDDLDNMDLSLGAAPAPATSNKPAVKKPATPMDVDLSGFQSLDMESFSYVPLAEAQKDTSIPIEKEEEDLAKVLLGNASLSGLDSIPDFDGAPHTQNDIFEEQNESVQDNTVHVPKGSLADEPPGEPEMLSFDFDAPKPAPSAAPAAAPADGIRQAVPAEAELNTVEEPEVQEVADLQAVPQQDSFEQVPETMDSVETLSVDDIVDSPEESNVDVDMISKAVDMDVAQDAQMAQAAEAAQDVQPAEDSADDMSFEDISLDDLSQLTADNGFFDNSQPSVNPVPPQTQSVPAAAATAESNVVPVSASSSAGSDMPNNGNSDLTMLFEESQKSLSDDVIDENYRAVETSGFVPSLPHLPERQSGGKGKLIGAAVFVALIVAGTFFGLSMKNKNELADVEAISQPVPENTELPPVPGTEQPVQSEGENTNIEANAPEVIDMPQNQAEPTNVKKEAPKDNKVTGAKPVNPEGSIMSVKKLSWELPDYLSYSQEMKKYLQTAGRSIKLTLTSDLLLTSEYAYSNQVKVSMKLSKDGNLTDSKIVTSSGSKEIDDIVLQTVKETLNVVKPPQGEVPTPDYSLGLIINF